MNLCFIFDILRGVLFVTDCVEVIKPEFCQKNSLEDFGDFIIRGELTRTVKCKGRTSYTNLLVHYIVI